MLFDDEPLTWLRFQAAGPATQALMAEHLLREAMRVKGSDYTNVECRYVANRIAEDGETTVLGPICLIGWCLYELDGAPSGFSSRDVFLDWLTGKGQMNDDIGKTLGLHPTTVIAWSVAQQAVDDGATWGLGYRIAQRAFSTAMQYQVETR